MAGSERTVNRGRGDAALAPGSWDIRRSANNGRTGRCRTPAPRAARRTSPPRASSPPTGRTLDGSTGHAGLRPGRYALLTLIAGNPGPSQSALGAAAGRDKSTLAPAVADLERRGLIRRERAPGDRRSCAVTLTGAGEAVLRDLRAHAAAHDRHLDALVAPATAPPSSRRCAA